MRLTPLRWAAAVDLRPALVVAGAFLVLAAWSATALEGARTSLARAVRKPAPLPVRLHETGLFADATATRVDPAHLPFSPQYPLWTDGADKRRWISLPPGTWIDARDPDDWRFPAGTRVWKTFSFGGRPVETRYMEALADGGWRYATYVWNDDGDDATQAPERGIPSGVPVTGGAGRHVVPSHADCVACHEGRPSPVLGFGHLQLSPDRDPLAPHGAHRDGDVDLRWLLDRDLVRGLPKTRRARAPRVAAASPTERAALGYLHGNCGGCHNDVGPLAPLGLVLAQSFAETDRDGAVLASTVDRPSRFRAFDHPGATVRIAPGHPERSVLAVRLGATEPHVRMPPIGSLVVDEEAAALIERWIREDLPNRHLASRLHN